MSTHELKIKIWFEIYTYPNKLWKQIFKSFLMLVQYSQTYYLKDANDNIFDKKKG